MLLKTKLAMAILIATVGLTACTENNEKPAEEAKTEAMAVSTETADKSEDLSAQAGEKAAALKEDAKEAYNEVKEEATDAVEEVKDEAQVAKDAAAAKIKEACIASKEKLGQSTDGC
jgi:gas vesicle protein